MGERFGVDLLIVLAGQSNMAGRGDVRDPATRRSSPRAVEGSASCFVRAAGLLGLASRCTTTSRIKLVLVRG